MTTVIVRVAARVLTPVMLLVALFLLVRGHDAPGGGFVAAAVAGLALVFRTYAFGVQGLAGLGRLSAENMLGGGLLLAIAVGAGGWLWGDAFLATSSVTWRVWLLGRVELSSATLFEVAVFVLTSSVVVAVLSELAWEDR